MKTKKSLLKGTTPEAGNFCGFSLEDDTISQS